MAKRKPRPITARNACDRLFSQIVRSRGACQRCGRTDRLECAHIVIRTYAHTRTDEANAWALCTWCHRESHRDPRVFMNLVDATVGPYAYEMLRRKAEAGIGIKFDWFAERERLAALLKEMAL